ncbi:type II secretion system protein D [Prosthecobacter fusiformis]|uniref:Type II secretion system protein D n=1 Tax=Prosthecobacter fusiformis TaxID=48464 RepID=A0A4R7RMQ6_9BACT|nr:secretin N-terminal domain-containing protein [Prosthecobacter fusiformis]TDU66015.1 type II secretion system protein D [Prosthecobacter fusiformis]
MPVSPVHFSPRQASKRLLIALALGALILASSHAQQNPALSENATIKVNFPNTPVQAIIPFYTQITGKKIILDSALQGEPLRIIAPEPLTRREAVAFIEATLLLNGYAIIPVNESTVKLIHHSGGKSPTPEGLKVYNSIKDLPDNEELCHFVMPLQHISPDEASKAFQQVIKLHSYGAIMPMKNAAALIITENSTTIRSIYEIAQVIDVPPAEIANEMIKLERSDAESIAEIIGEIYAEEEKTESAPAQSIPAAPPVATNGARAPALNPMGIANTANTNPSVARVRVIPHRRTNSILVIARPVDITYIRGLVEKLDQQAGDVTFLKRKLAYLDVGDFLPVAYNALAKDTDIQSEGADSASGGGRRSSSSRRPSASSNTPSTDASRDSSSSNDFGQNLQGGFGGQGNNRNERSLLDDPDAISAPESLVVGKTLLIADPQSNSLVVSGSPEHIAVIDQLIQEMDVRPQQVYISTIIGQLNLGGDFKYGFDFLNMLDDFTLRQKDVTTPNGVDLGGALNIPFNMEKFGTSSMSFYGQLGSLSRYVNLLEGNKNFKVLSTPSLYTTNNGKAVISSGQRIAVPVNILSNAGINNIAATSASIEYRDVVLKLEVVPLINNDNEVTLRIAQVNDNIVGEQNISGNTVPTIGTQELLTTVTVRDGATVVLGGLITERTENTERGAIFLRRVPVLKHLFGTTEKGTTRDELLIFIQPKIINSTAQLDSPNNIEARRSRIMEETLEFGMPLKDIPRALPADK